MTTPEGAQNDLAAYVEWDQWSVQQEYGRQGATATFVLTTPTGYTGPHDSPLTQAVKVMSTVELTDTGTGQVVYAGIAQQPYLVFLSATLIQYWIQCVDFTYYADSALVTASYPPTAGDQIIRQLSAAANDTGAGITPGTITPAPTVSGFQANYLQLTDAWDQVGNLVSWQDDYNWQVDKDLNVDWQTAQSIAAPALANPGGYVTFTDDVTGQPTDLVGHIDVSQMFQYIWDGSSLRNRCVVQGADTTQTTTQNFLGDGTAAQWVLTYDLDGSVAATLTVNGVSQTIAVASAGGTATTDYILVQSTIDGVWSLAVGTASVPSAGDVLALSYTYNVPITVKVDDPTSQREYGGPNRGVFAVYLSDSTITSKTDAYKRAAAELNQYAYVLETFTFTTAAGWPGHIDVGDPCTISTQYVPDALNDWNVGIDDVYVVVRNNIQGVKGGYRTYELTCIRYHTLANIG